MKDRYEGVRYFAAKALGKLGHPDASPHLVKVLKEEDEAGDVVYSAIGALGRIGGAGVIPHLEEVLENGKFSIFYSDAIKALGFSGHVLAIPPLRRVLTEAEDEFTRRRAAEALGKLGFVEVIPHLGKALLEDKGTQVRYKAATMLGEIGHPDAIPYLGEALVAIVGKDFGDEDLASAYTSALEDIGDAAAIPYLVEYLNKETTGFRNYAVIALGKIGHPDAIPYLVNVLLGDAFDASISSSMLAEFDNWKEKADLIVQALQESQVQRSHISASYIVKAIQPSEAEPSANKYLLTDYLIAQAIERNERMTEIFAGLIVVSTNKSATLAGVRLDEYQKAHGLSQDKLRALRIAIGGQTALGPILSVIATKPTLFVEGLTDVAIMEAAINLFDPELTKLVQVKSESGSGANWVKDQIIAWVSLRIKLLAGGLFDNDEGGRNAKKELDDWLRRRGNPTARSFKLPTPKHLYGIFHKGLKVPVTLEEMLPPHIWEYAKSRKWLEDRTDAIQLNEFSAFDKTFRQQCIDSGLDEHELLYVLQRVRNKGDLMRYVEQLSPIELEKALAGFKPLVEELASYLKNSV